MDHGNREVCFQLYDAHGNKLGHADSVVVSTKVEGEDVSSLKFVIDLKKLVARARELGTAGNLCIMNAEGGFLEEEMSDDEVLSAVKGAPAPKPYLVHVRVENLGAPLQRGAVGVGHASPSTRRKEARWKDFFLVKKSEEKLVCKKCQKDVPLENMLPLPMLREAKHHARFHHDLEFLLEVCGSEEDEVFKIARDINIGEKKIRTDVMCRFGGEQCLFVGFHV
jgi:hypothetical protein